MNKTHHRTIQNSINKIIFKPFYDLFLYYFKNMRVKSSLRLSRWLGALDARRGRKTLMLDQYNQG